MSAPPAPAARPRARGLWTYNLRILLGNSYWLIITPIVIAQLVLFWNIATSGLSSVSGSVRTIEILAPILGALLCAYAVAPEQAGVGELVFVRPISLEKLLLLRLTAIFAFILVLLLPPLAIYHRTVQDFPLLPALLSGLVSALFLSALAMALASATRQPLLGLGIAGAFWAFDFLLGSYFNPLFTLQTYADHLSGAPMSDLWLYGKAALLVAAILVYAWNRRLLGRPAAPRRALAILHTALLVSVILFTYLYIGAAGKIVYLRQNEANLGNQAWMSYQQAFRAYGPLPVPWLFGSAFPLYLQAELGRTPPLVNSAVQSPLYLKRLKLLLEQYPGSVWADHAAFELARARSRAPAAPPMTLFLYQAGEPPRQQVVESDELGMADAMLALAERYPRSSFAPLALSQRGRVGETLLDFDLAVDAYARVLARYPSSPQAVEAGFALSALYLREGKGEEALKAAEIATRAVRWDLRPRAYLLAGDSARAAGNATLARQHYQQARDAAEAAVKRAGERVHGGGTAFSPARIIQESQNVTAEATRALSGGLTAPLLPPAHALLVGRLTQDGVGLAGARVVVGQPGALSYPSPFSAESFGQAVTASDGSFTLAGLAPGSYRAIAFALPGTRRSWEVAGLALPIRVTAPRTVLPPLALARQVAQPAPPPPQPGGLRTNPSGGGGGRGGGRGGGGMDRQPGGPHR